MSMLNQRRVRLELVALLVLLIGAAGLRLYRLDRLPPGLALDEVMDGNLAIDILGGRHGIYFPEAYGHETLFHYLQAVSIGLLGHTPLSIRLPAALCGWTLILLIWWLGRQRFGPLAAWIAAGGAAGGWWGVFYSRVGIRAISCPLLFTAALIGFWGGLRLEGWKKWLALTLGSVLTGLCLYTYPSSRVIVVLPVLILLHQWLFNRRMVYPHRWALILYLVIFLLVAAPMIVYLSTHAEERAAQLGEPLERLRAGDPGPVLRLAGDTLLMLLGLRGDLRWLYNLAGRPIWGPVWVVLFLIGLAVSIGRFRQPEYAMLSLWLFLGLMPGMLTPDAPNTIRTLAAMPAAYLLAGLGGKTMAGWLSWLQATLDGRRLAVGGRWSAIGHLLPAILILGHGLFTWRDLNRWADEFEAQWRYQMPLFEAARALRSERENTPIYVSLPLDAELFVTSFQLALNDPTQEWRWFVGNRALPFPPAGQAGRYLFTDGVAPDPALAWLGEGEASARRRPDGQPFYRLYRLAAPDVQTLAPERIGYLEMDQSPLALDSVNWADAVTLLGYRRGNATWHPGDEAVLLSVWQVQAAQDRSLALFVHLLDTQGKFTVGEDRLDLPAHTWQSGDIFAQVQRFVLPPDLTPGRYWIELGWYRRSDNTRLPILQQGQVVADRLLLAPIEIKP